MDYLEDVVTAIEFIEAHLFEDNLYKEVFNHVHLSKYHFHRIFLASTYHTLGGYIKKRRFTVIANLVSGSEKKIVDIALACGYESHEAFTRAFKSYFQMAPYAYRKRKRENPLLLLKPMERELIESIQGKYLFVPKIERICGVNLKGYGFETTLNDHQLEAYWGNLFRFIEENQIQTLDQYGYTIWLDENKDPSGLSNDENYRAFIGINLAGQGIEHLDSYALEPGEYAVFRIEEEFEYIHEVYRYIYFQWLKKSNYELREGYVMERYSPDFSYINHSGCMWIMIPVQEKQ